LGDSHATNSEEAIMFIGTTNMLNSIDPAAIRRLTRRSEVLKSTGLERKAMIKAVNIGVPVFYFMLTTSQTLPGWKFTEEELDMLCGRSHGYSQDKLVKYLKGVEHKT